MLLCLPGALSEVFSQLAVPDLSVLNEPPYSTLYVLSLLIWPTVMTLVMPGLKLLTDDSFRGFSLRWWRERMPAREKRKSINRQHSSK